MKRRNPECIPKCCICGAPCRRANNSKGLQVCSKECRAKKNTKQCKGCGKPFFSRPGNREQYCSHECYRPAKVVKPCEVCGRRVRRSANSNRFVCGGSCSAMTARQAQVEKAKDRRSEWRKNNPCPMCNERPRKYQKETCGAKSCLAAILMADKTPWSPFIGEAWQRFRNRLQRREAGQKDPWRRKCRTAVRTLQKRRIVTRAEEDSAVSVGIAIGLDEALRKAYQRFQYRAKRRLRNQDPWRAKAESVYSNLRKRRRHRNARAERGNA